MKHAKYFTWLCSDTLKMWQNHWQRLCYKFHDESQSEKKFENWYGHFLSQCGQRPSFVGMC